MPLSSAHCVTGNTTSASAAVSDRTTSQTISASSAAQPVLDVGGVGRADHRVGSGDQQHPHVAPECIEQFVGGRPRSGQIVRINAPDMGDVGAVGRIRQLAVARQLVGLLAVFAPALAVALPGEGAVPAMPAAGQAAGEREVDPGERGVGAMGVLLGAPRGQDHRGRRVKKHPRGPLQHACGHAGRTLDSPWPPCGSDPA